MRAKDHQPMPHPESAAGKRAAYKKANPLGGPAKVFDAMASRIRAGEDYYEVLRDYGFVVESKYQEITRHAEAMCKRLQSWDDRSNALAEYEAWKTHG